MMRYADLLQALGTELPDGYVDDAAYVLGIVGEIWQQAFDCVQIEQTDTLLQASVNTKTLLARLNDTVNDVLIRHREKLDEMLPKYGVASTKALLVEFNGLDVRLLR